MCVEPNLCENFIQIEQKMNKLAIAYASWVPSEKIAGVYRVRWADNGEGGCRGGVIVWSIDFFSFKHNIAIASYYSYLLSVM